MSRLNVVTSTNDFTCYTKSQATVVGFACVLAAIIALQLLDACSHFAPRVYFGADVFPARLFQRTRKLFNASVS
jgi:hypothetical protein